MDNFVQTVLKPGEQAVLVVYPEWRWLTPANIISVLFAAVWLFVIGKISFAVTADGVNSENLLVLLFLLPFTLVGICMAISPFWRRLRLNRTRYVVTNLRAIVVQPSDVLLKPEIRSWPLAPDLVKAVEARLGGTGDIIFDYLQVPTKHGYKQVPLGFLCVPELDRVHRLLQEQIAATAPETAEPSTPDPWAQALPQPASRRLSWKWGFLFITPGLFLVAIGGMSLYKYLQLQEHGNRTIATIVQRESGDAPNLTVRFTDAKGYDISAETMMGSSTYARYQAGDEVEIVYLPTTPSYFDLVRHDNSFFFFTLIAIGGSFIFSGIIVAVSIARKNRE